MARHQFRCMMAHPSRKTKMSYLSRLTIVPMCLASQQHQIFPCRITTLVFLIRSLHCQIWRRQEEGGTYGTCFITRDAYRHTKPRFTLTGPLCGVLIRVTCHHPSKLDISSAIPSRHFVVRRASFYDSHTQLCDLRRVRNCHGMCAAARLTAAEMLAQHPRYYHTQLYERAQRCRVYSGG